MLLSLVAYRPVHSVGDGLHFFRPTETQLLEWHQDTPLADFWALQQIAQSDSSGTASESASPASIKPESAADFYALGVDSQRMGQIEAAIQAYRRAIDLDTTMDVAYINLGLAYIQLGQFDNAMQTFQQVLSLPDRPERPASIHTVAHYNLAIILNRQGKSDEALMEVQKALTITPDFSRAQQLLQQIQSR